jgi:cell division protein FtsB
VSPHHIYFSSFIFLSGLLIVVPVSSQNYWNKVYRYVAGAVVCLALIGVAFAFWPKVDQFRSYPDTKAELEAEIHVEQERINQLRLNQEKFRTDKHFVQKIAHETGFAHEGETIYQFEEPVSTAGGSKTE